MGRLPKSGRVRPKLCHLTAVTCGRGETGTENRHEHNPVYSISSGHLGYAKRSAGRVISGSGQFPRSLRTTGQYVHLGSLPGFGELPPHEGCVGVWGNKDQEFA